MLEPLALTVYGEAQPAGSKTPGMTKDGRMYVRDANPASREWKDRVAAAAGAGYDGPLLTGPVRLSLTFYRARGRGHFGSGRNEGRVLDSAPVYPTTKPDLTKLIRGTEDALIGIVYRDDSQVVETVAAKMFGNPVRVEITVTPLADRTVGQLRQPALLAA